MYKSRNFLRDSAATLPLLLAVGYLLALGPAPALALGSVTLAWDPVPGSTAYNIHYGVASRRYTNSIRSSAEPSVTIRGLVEGVTYYFTATALDANGLESKYSEEMVYALARPRVTSPAPFAAAQGYYGGLVYQARQAQPGSSGAFSLLLSSRGSYSAWLRLGLICYVMAGKLDAQGQIIRVIPRAGAHPLTLRLGFNSGAPTDRIVGTLSSDTWAAYLVGERTSFSSGCAPVPWAGAYTLFLPEQAGSPTPAAGKSLGTARVTPSGLGVLAGVLADGTRFSQSARITQSGLWPLYVPLNAGQSALLSWLTLTNRLELEIEH